MRANISIRYIILALVSFSSGICIAQTWPDQLPTRSQDSSQKSRKELLAGIRKRIQSVQGKMKSFEKNDWVKPSRNSLPAKEYSNFKQPNDLSGNSQGSKIEPNQLGSEEKSKAPYWSDNPSGLYFLPFVGFSYASDFNLKLAIGSLNLTQKNGFLSGFRLGYDWQHLYLEQRSHYFKNPIKNGDLFTTSGKVSGFSTLIGGGLKFPLSEYTKWILGGGIGGSSQEVQAKIESISKTITESGLVITYQLSTGVEFRPFEHFLLGCHYNWFYSQEFSSISNRHLHAIELSLGYFH